VIRVDITTRLGRGRIYFMVLLFRWTVRSREQKLIVFRRLFAIRAALWVLNIYIYITDKSRNRTNLINTRAKHELNTTYFLFSFSIYNPNFISVSYLIFNRLTNFDLICISYPIFICISDIQFHFHFLQSIINRFRRLYCLLHRWVKMTFLIRG